MVRIALKGGKSAWLSDLEHPMHHFIKTIIKDSQGTSVLELALVLPIFLVLLLSGIDASMVFAQQLRVEAAAARSIEQITAYSRGKVDDAISKSEAAAAAGVPVSEIVVDKWLECKGVRQSKFTGTCPKNNDQIARFVKVTVNGKYKPIINFGKFLPVGSDGFVKLVGDASVRVQ
jgi:Flp pilus assembly protein TadG